MTRYHPWRRRLAGGLWATLLAASPAAAGCGRATIHELVDASGSSADAGPIAGADAQPRTDATPGLPPGDASPTDALPADASPTDPGPAVDAAPSCADVDLGSAVGFPVHVGDTRGLTDDAQTCEGDGMGDISFLWTAPSSGRFRFDTCGSSYDTALSARMDDCGGAQIACNDDANACGNGSLQSRILLDLTAGQRVILIVDGFSGSDGEGPFVLNIEPR
jgi:hypothetical protein